MAQLIAIGLLVGMILGQRYKVLVLAPAIVLTLVVTAAAGLFRADGGWTIAAACVATVTALQLGYLLGGVLRSFATGKPAHGAAAARDLRPVP
jgi:hypothetical protein